MYCLSFSQVSKSTVYGVDKANYGLSVFQEIKTNMTDSKYFTTTKKGKQYFI